MRQELHLSPLVKMPGLKGLPTWFRELPQIFKIAFSNLLVCSYYLFCWTKLTVQLVLINLLDCSTCFGCVRFCRIADENCSTTVLKTKNFGIVSLDLAQLVHELQLMNPDVSGSVAGRQLFPVVRYSNTTNPVSLIVRFFGAAFWVGRVCLLDVVEVGVHVDGLEELV